MRSIPGQSAFVMETYGDHIPDARILAISAETLAAIKHAVYEAPSGFRPDVVPLNVQRLRMLDAAAGMLDDILSGKATLFLSGLDARDELERLRPGWVRTQSVRWRR